ncbi:MAG: two-component sensor histidine kinase [Crocinitomix sp.]
MISYVATVRTKKYRTPVMVSLILLTTLNIFNLSLSSNFHHIGDYFWVICIVTSGFFVLGKKWGIVLVIVNLVVIYVIFYLIRIGTLEQVPKPFTDFSQVNFLINLCIGGVLFSFLIIQFLKENEDMAKKYLLTNSELQLLNEEKTVMLKEIHHRVKNNLQIVTSLLRLQTSDVDDPKVLNEFAEAIDRISAIAKIHEKMYNNKALNQIDLSEYLEDLIRDLLDSYTDKNTIQAEINSNINFIPPKDLVPIALIFNELVTNSVKHAFKSHTHSKIVIDAFITNENRVRLSYSDNGNWTEPKKVSQSVGLDLIDSFVEQLDGTYKIDKTNGTKYVIDFMISE